MAESAAAAAAAAEGAAGAGAATTPVTSAMDDQVPPHLTSLPSDAVPGSISESLGASSVESAGQEARAEATMDDGHSQDGSFGVHRRRLRSSSLRGLLGFQFTGNAGATRERVRGTGIDRGFTPVQRRSRAQSSDAADAPTQNPFVRLLNEIGRGVRGQQNNGQDGANGQTNGSTLPTNATRQNRRHTTIHLIHIGGGTFEAARRGSGPTTTTTMTTGTPSGDRPESPAGTGEITDAILMFLSNPRLNLGANGEHLEDTQISNGGTTRPRSRGSPLVVVLSGAPGTYLSSLLAGAEGGEEAGMSYDDLWWLSNMIGPARPVTTTQEAIDNAGFHVGPFSNATQGMQGYEVLGDGSKCLVCMNEYEEGEEMRALRCRHGFHQECIDK
ncbi:hypothetical protein BGX31_003080, partial [Mortierella sp. GBA43]